MPQQELVRHRDNVRWQLSVAVATVAVSSSHRCTRRVEQVFNRLENLGFPVPMRLAKERRPERTVQENEQIKPRWVSKRPVCTLTQHNVEQHFKVVEKHELGRSGVAKDVAQELERVPQVDDATRTARVPARVDDVQESAAKVLHPGSVGSQHLVDKHDLVAGCH